MPETPSPHEKNVFAEKERGHATILGHFQSIRGIILAASALVATQTINALNPDVKVEPIAETISESNILDLLKGTDIVIDGLDSFETRYIVNKACVKLGIPYVLL